MKGKIQTLLYEPRFELFYETPIYELTRTQKEDRLSMNIEHIVPVDERRPWPEVEYLFGEDENYTDIVADIIRNVTLSIKNVTQFCDVFAKISNFFFSIQI